MLAILESDMRVIDRPDIRDLSYIGLAERAVALVDGAYEVVELYQPKSHAQEEWKREWLRRAREVGAVSMSPSTSLFDRCVRRIRVKPGTVRYACRRGLWSVEGHDENYVVKEARRYWYQYYSDGEYSSLLSNNSISDTGDGNTGMEADAVEKIMDQSNADMRGRR